MYIPFLPENFFFSLCISFYYTTAVIIQIPVAIHPSIHSSTFNTRLFIKAFYSIPLVPTSVVVLAPK